MTGQEHRDIQEDLPAFVTSRLEAADRARVERHVEGCSACADLVAAYREIDSAVQQAGEAMAAPHPDPMVLRDRGLGRPVAAADEIEEHLRACASCELEASTWERHRRRDGDGRPSPRWPMGLAAAAAGVLLGLALSLWWSASGPGPAGGQGLIYLRVMRGAETIRHTLDADDRFVTLAVPIDVPASLPDESTLTFDVMGPAGRRLWTAEVGAGRARRLIARSEVVSFSLPADRLAAGPHELRAHAAAAAGRRELLRVRFDIVREE